MYSFLCTVYRLGPPYELAKCKPQESNVCLVKIQCSVEDFCPVLIHNTKSKIVPFSVLIGRFDFSAFQSICEYSQTFILTIQTETLASKCLKYVPQ